MKFLLRDHFFDSLTLDSVDPSLLIAYWAGVSSIHESYSGSFEKTLGNDNVIDFENTLLRKSLMHKVFPAVHIARVRHDSAYANSPSSKKGSQIFELYQELNAAMKTELQEICGHLKLSDIPLLLLKGADPFIQSLLGKDVPRVMHDSDVLIRNSDIVAAKGALAEMQYKQGTINSEELTIDPIPLISESEKGHYKLRPFFRIREIPQLDKYLEIIRNDLIMREQFLIRDEKIYYAFEIDLHLKVAVDIATEDFWNEAREISFGSLDNVFGLNFTDLLWFFVARLYFETLILNEGRLRFFHDVIGILYKRGNSIDWSRLMAMAVKYRLQPSLYYVLSHVADLFPELVPSEILGDLRVSKAVGGQDLGDPFPKLLEIYPRFTVRT